MKRLLIALAMISLLLLAACAPPMDRPAADDTDGVHETEGEEPAPMNDTMVVNDSVDMSDVPDEMTDAPEQDLSDLPVKEVTEGDFVNFPNLKATDPDGDPVEYTFTAPLSANGEWQTEEGDAGDHVVTITASDGTNVVDQDVIIRVLPKNKAPVIDIDAQVEFEEGDTVELNPIVTDANGDEVTVSYSGWMTANTKETGFEDAGNHKVVISATDGKLTTTREVIVIISNFNREPDISALDNIEVVEGDTARIKPTATDPDGDDVSFTYSEPFSADGTWKTQLGDEGSYTVTVTASDGELDSESTLKVVVLPANRAPVIELDSPVQATEGELLQLEPTITDKEGDEVTVKYSGWMTSSTKQLGYEDEGNHKVTITATDSAGNKATLEVIVSVENVNRPPTFGAGSFE